MPDVIVTGLPRSGLTMVAALIDGMPNAVCLNAPLLHTTQAPRLRSQIAYAKWLTGDFRWTRAQLLRQEPVSDWRADDGLPLLDTLKDPRKPEAPVSFARPTLKGDFILGMKHHAIYTALLPALVKFQHFKIIAVIRHPLDVLTSWQSLPQEPIGQANLFGIRRFWPEADRIARSSDELTVRMVQLYDIQIGRYHALREEITILKYEDVVRDPMRVSRLFDIDRLPNAAARIEQRRPLRNSADTQRLRELFRRYGVFTRQYYPDL